ncbi:MAG TPA: hypothetical protein VGH43_15685 [Jatrophihabitans sp.]
MAVVHDPDGLTDDDIAAFARRTNLSETDFLTLGSRTSPHGRTLTSFVGYTLVTCR